MHGNIFDLMYNICAYGSQTAVPVRILCRLLYPECMHTDDDTFSGIKLRRESERTIKDGNWVNIGNSFTSLPNNALKLFSLTMFFSGCNDRH